jgi:hypothetical protein
MRSENMVFFFDKIYNFSFYKIYINYWFKSFELYLKWKTIELGFNQMIYRISKSEKLI